MARNTDKEVHASMQRVYEATGKTASQIAFDIHELTQTITNWDKRGISKRGAIAINKAYGMNVNFILTGIKPLDGTESSPISKSNGFDRNIVFKSNKKLLPVLSWVQAGKWTNMESVDLSEVSKWLPALSEDDPEECFYLQVVGVSNAPYYLEGDFILVDPTADSSHLISGDLIVVRKENNEATFKKLIIESDGSRYLQAMNPGWQPNIMPLDSDSVLIGLVLDAFRPIGGSRKHRVRK